MKNKFKYALLGYGEFARQVIHPCLVRHGGFELKSVLVHNRERQRKMLAENSVPCTVTCDIMDILNDKSIDCVFVLTRHDSHAAQIIKSLENGKAVFTEKPPAMNIADMERIIKTLNRTGGKFMTGFNRRFAPLTAKLKNVLSRISPPYVINYCWMNPPWDDDWPFHPAQGGGKLVSSGCHMVDLIYYLMGHEPEYLHCRLNTTVRKNISTHDTANLSLAYADGSTVNICTGEMGSPGFPAEKMEIFTRQGIIVMKDFNSLEFFGPEFDNVKLDGQDKGFTREIEAFYEYLKQPDAPSPVSVRESFMVMKCIEKALKASGKLSGTKKTVNLQGGYIHEGKIEKVGLCG